MAADFGDEAGEELLQWFKRAVDHAAPHPHGKDGKKSLPAAALEWFKEKFMNAGMSESEAQAAAEIMAARPTKCIPFGNMQDAAYFAKFSQENGTYCQPLKDKNGNGYIQFAVEDAKDIERFTTPFSELLARMQLERVTANEKAVPEKEIAKFKEIKKLPNLPDFKNHDAAQETGRANQNTRELADAAKDAQGRCRDFDEFKEILAAKGIGVTLSARGENMLYKAEPDGHGGLLPYDHDRRDWAVSAEKLRDNYGVDVTQDWFDKQAGSGRESLTHEMTNEEIAEAVRGDLETDGIPTYDSDKYAFCVMRADVEECDKACGVYDKTREELNIGVIEPGRDEKEMALQAEKDGEIAEPVAADGSMDMDGRTPDINQGIESHDGRDTNTNTFRMEYEATGSGDVAPSRARASLAQGDEIKRNYSMDSMKKECRAASKYQETSRGIEEHVTDISDKMAPSR